MELYRIRAPKVMEEVPVLPGQQSLFNERIVTSCAGSTSTGYPTFYIYCINTFLDKRSRIVTHDLKLFAKIDLGITLDLPMSYADIFKSFEGLPIISD